VQHYAAANFLQPAYQLTVQIGVSAYMAVAAAYYASQAGYGLICNEFDPQEQNITFVQWVFYVSKIFDFMDTIFMVLRSKWDQFSFLHTYHHASIFVTYWWVANTGA
jgi:elongation of very long chain fatty acids protein 4